MAEQKGYMSMENQNDGWVMVDMKVSTKSHTKSRHPQYNGDNEPSGHKAKASTSPSRNNSFTFNDIENCGQDGYPIAIQKTESNTSSTLTAQAATHTTTRPQYNAPPNNYMAAQALTESRLQRHQQEQEHLAAISEWISHSGTDYRFTQYPATSTHESMVVGRSMPSTTGSTRGWHSYSGPSPPVGTDDTVLAGAWCDAPIKALIYGSPYPGFGSE